jgi:hypothetical protein
MFNLIEEGESLRGELHYLRQHWTSLAVAGVSLS